MRSLRSYKTILGLTYLQLALIFTIAVLLRELQLIHSFTLNFSLFAFLLPLLALPALLDLPEPLEKEAKVSQAARISIILLIITLVIALRLCPYRQNPVPLGYDPGFYKYTMEVYIHALPDIPEESLPVWMKEMQEQGLFVLMVMLHLLARLDPLDALTSLFPLLCGLLTLPLFMLARSIFNERVAFIAAALYAGSYTQYTAFTYLYFKNIIGLILLLLAIYALEKRRYAVFTLMYAALGIYHRPEFLLSSLTLVAQFIKTRDKNLIAGILLTAVLITPFWLPRFALNWKIMTGVAGSAVSALQGTPIGGGTFFGYETYRWISLAYLPFGLVGTLAVTLKRNFHTLLFYFLICGTIVILKLFFYNRLLIDLDLALLILAAAGIEYTFVHLLSTQFPAPSHRTRMNETVLKALAGLAIGIIILSSGLVTLKSATQIKPLLNEDQLQAITWLATNTEPESSVLATSYDAPWVLGWSDRKVVAPGLFHWDTHTKSEWLEFLSTSDVNLTRRFLARYEHPLYIYYSRSPGNYLNLEKFENDQFELVYTKGAVIYRYNIGGTPLE